MNKLIAFSLIITAAMHANAQSLPIASPETVGMSSTRLQRIDQWMQTQMKAEKLVGGVTMVARQGRIVHFAATGLADVETDRPYTTDSIFRIYSMTKPITSVAAMMLYEEGKFQLSDPIAWYLPELAKVKVFTANGTERGGREPPHRPISVHDVLTHRGGFTYGIFGETQVDKMYRKVKLVDLEGDTADMVRKLADLPLISQPGEQWNYSVSTDVLSRMIEVLSGQRLDVFFQERILEPLAMHDTAFKIPPERVARFTVNYQWNLQGKRYVADHPSKSPYLKQPSFFSGGGGLVSTAEDYLRFCQMLLNGGVLGDVRLLSPKTVELMTMNHLGDAKQPTDGIVLGDGAGFGLGFRVITDVAANERMVSTGTYGWGGMASTMFFIDPREELIGILLTQKFPTDLRIRDEFQTAVYQSLIDLEPIPK